MYQESIYLITFKSFLFSLQEKSYLETNIYL